MKTKTNRIAEAVIPTRKSVSFLGFNRDMKTHNLQMVRNCPVLEIKVLVKRNGEVQVSGNNLSIQ